MFDEVWFDDGLHDSRPKGRRFQTKALDRCMDRYIVTQAGRLCLVGSVLLDETPATVAPGEAAKTDVDFHGDIRLVSDDEKHEQYIARFTHGTLEWIRPMSDVPRFNRPKSDSPEGTDP